MDDDRPVQLPGKHVTAELTFVTQGRPIEFVPRGRLGGVRLVATDLAWSWGAGPEVAGRGAYLLLVGCGRATALLRLRGDAVDLLRHRLGAPTRWIDVRARRAVSLLPHAGKRAYGYGRKHTARTPEVRMSSTTNPTPASPTVTQVTEVVLPGVVEPEGLQLRMRALAAPRAGQAVVAVDATGISMAEQSMRRGRYPGQPRFPFVPGYDLVGTVTATGPGVDTALVGSRVAAMTKTGGWATHAVLPAEDLVVVPRELDPAEVETLVVNGVTAWQMLHHSARVQRGETVLVHGASGGVGTTLVQLARHEGISVIGTAHPRHHDALRALGVVPVDYDDPQLSETVRALAPQGVDAVFDHLGGESLDRSWALLAPGGRLVAYAIATNVRGTGSVVVPFVAALAKVLMWNALPNGKRAYFYNLWSGHTVRPARFRRRTREAVDAVLRLLADGTLSPQVAATFPLTQVREAMALAESRTVRGKVVLLP